MLSGPNPLVYFRNFIGFYLGRHWWRDMCPGFFQRPHEIDHDKNGLWFAYRNDEFEGGINNQDIAFAEIKEILKEVKQLRLDQRAAAGLGKPSRDCLPDFFS